MSQKLEMHSTSKPDKCAVVTGANKGFGLEIVRRLASEGIQVVLTARNEKRGMDATTSLLASGLSNVVFHQLDVRDPASADSLANFIQSEYGRLDILVNNAGASGVVVDEEGLKALNIDPIAWVSMELLIQYSGLLKKYDRNTLKLIELMQLSGKANNIVQGVIKHTYESGEECLDTNYFGCKRVTEALMPLLKLCSSGARIINVSSLRSELKRLPNEQIRTELGDICSLTEDQLDCIIKQFLHDLKQGKLEENGWPMMLPAYSISKMTLNAYTRVLAKKYPDMYINCVHPGYVNTDINWHTGTMSIEEGAKGPVMLALLPNGGPSGCYFDQTEKAEF
ncbi:hypothetical protein IFM89_025451 [Coptis chinensis]|uniref:Uncharacterized protein n=1 Tax=Coptis chinensis TaxID=261450 RepID=A0A835IFU5_9MAGN|nr:hypothetical protein IFM89_025451 [Coptis chinensis]